MVEHAYGRTADIPDFRDFKLASSSIFVGSTLPDSVDLRESPYMPPIWDQGRIGACVAFGVDALIVFLRAMSKLPGIQPSHLFQYYNARLLEKSTGSDSGSSIRDGIKAAAKYGTAPDTLWPYDVSKFKSKPPKPAYTEALRHQALVYKQVPQREVDIKVVLASGLPFTFGITVYSSFESLHAEKTGIIPMPSIGDTVLGGHDLVAVGYDPDYVLFRNHWSMSWGEHGYGRLPWAYVLSKIASDFWSITAEEA